MSALDKTPLVVDAEKLTFHCNDSFAGPRCRFRAQYDVRNPTDAVVEQTAAFVGIRTGEVKITVAGRSAAHQLTPEQSTTMRDLVARWLPRSDACAAGDCQETLHGLRFRLEPGQATTMVVEGVTKPGPEGRQGEGYVISGLRGRHLLLGSDSVTEPDIRYLFEYPIAPIHSWGAVGNIDIEVHYDDQWELVGGLASERGEIPFQVVDDSGDMNVARLSTSGSDRGTILRMAFVDSKIPVYQGGPHVGVGGVVTKGSEFRMRFGYEIGAPDFLLHSVQVDTDFDDYVVVTPSTEFATPHILYIIPSLSLGAGVPIRVKPDTQVGVRAQGSINYFPVGFVTTVDIFPGAEDNDPHAVDVTLLARASL